MIPRSLHWRLPVSYAAIALLTAVALGMVLLTTLRGFYRQQELNYLTSNAMAMSEELAPIVKSDFADSSLPAQAKGLAFLSQTRVRVLNEDKSQLLADSQDATGGQSNTRLTLDVEIDGVEQTFSQSVVQEGELANTAYSSSIIIESNIFSRDVEERILVDEPGSGAEGSPFIPRVPVAGTLYGFGLNPGADVNSERSNITVDYPILSPTAELLGYVRLSEGPAYGRIILNNVAWSWAVAGIVAVTLAALAGWFASRRLTRPLITLTGVTMDMAAGDLNARAGSDRQDELGVLARSFNLMADRVQDTVSTLQQFVADAAHELHTPLTALRTNLELVSQQQERDKKAHAADGLRVQRSIQQVIRLQALTDRLLDLSRIEGQKAAFTRQEIDLNNLLGAIVEPYASQAEQNGQDLACQLPQETLTILGDETQLRQALDNLLDNSLKFTPPPGEILVALSGDQDECVIMIKDAGIGIPVEDHPLLFGRFHRARNTADYPGSGLGLAIVKAIIEKHDGRIEASSTGIGRGATFTIHLPRT